LGCSEREPDSNANAAGMAGSGGSDPTGGSAGSVETGGNAGATQSEAGVDAEPESACEPPPAPDSFYALEAQSLDRFDPVSMCEFRGKVVLVVNIAAKCGYTPQLGALADLQSQYADQDFTILGFYSNQFANQAGSEEERLVCEDNYGVNFEVFDIINVNPPDEHPIFTWFKSQDGFEGDVKWNFEKFLVSRDGRLIGRWPTATLPSALADPIDLALAETP
jgi:glutathione peroxidase